MSLVLHNSLHKTKEIFVPIQPKHIGMYVCGLTVYERAHIGHGRLFLAFDVIRRSLMHLGYEVRHICNHTDVDDKIIKRAAENHEDPRALASRYVDALKEDLAALQILPPQVDPRVTEHIPQIIKIIEKLVAKGYAYASKGDVYYAVERFADYGKLSGRNLEDLRAGESGRVEDEETARKRNPLDFALWKGAKPDEPASVVWESPWGSGRPGWHIECSAMSEEHLGETFDIHGGGKDLLFPHHENEIAQSEGASGKEFARYWMHVGYLNSVYEDEEGKRHFLKMSKSLKNFYTIQDVLRRHDAESFRYFCLGTHYRQDINFEVALGEDQSTVKAFPSLEEAAKRVAYGYETLRRLQEAIATSAAQGGSAVLPSKFAEEFVAAMEDDFNTSRALGVVADCLRYANEVLDRKEKPALSKPDRAATLVVLREQIQVFSSMLGLWSGEPSTRLRELRDKLCHEKGIDIAAVEALVTARTEARKNKDFSRADALRQELAAQGVQLQDKPTGTDWTVF